MYYLQIFSSAHHDMYDLKENHFQADPTHLESGQQHTLSQILRWLQYSDLVSDNNGLGWEELFRCLESL